MCLVDFRNLRLGKFRSLPSRLQELEARKVSLYVPGRLQGLEARKVSLSA